ncbi:MAG: RluA family pseudouridine synthase [Saprospiraceae bacterium]|nr:RluA family pseudouridine synthase [Saprospiraceae bacterium]
MLILVFFGGKNNGLPQIGGNVCLSRTATYLCRMNILFEDYYLLAINKPAGLSSESGRERHPSAEREALFYFTAQLQQKSSSERLKATPYLRVAHRLDRAASGVLLFAKTKNALTQLMEQFENKTVEKTYWAIVENKPAAEAGRLSNWLKRDEAGRKAIIQEKQTRDSQHCELEYKILNAKGKHWLLEIKPLTGRFHQIRVQLAHIGCPIVGDTLYGGHPWKEHEIKLHARSLRFKHPKTGEWMTLEVAPPEDW